MPLLIPLFNPQNEQDIAVLAQVCQQLSVPVVEVVLRSKFAYTAMRQLANKTQVWAGTVLTTEQVEMSLDNGAKQIVSPGFSSKIAAQLQQKGVNYIAGVATASEVQLAHTEYGLRQLKAFPASNLGGISWLKAMAAVYPQVQFFPTGGINAINVGDYLACKNVFAVGGSFLLPDDLTDAQSVITHYRRYHY